MGSRSSNKLAKTMRCCTKQGAQTSTRWANRREDRAAARGANESYVQMRDKAMNQRSKTVPAEIFIGDAAPKRARAVPPNQAALNRRAAPRFAAEKRASFAAEDRRTKPRGGAANAERAERRDAVYARQARMDKAAQRQVARDGDKRAAKNDRLYEDSQGNVKAKRPAKKAKTKKSVSQSMSFSPEAAARPEDRYGVRRRAPARGKSLPSSSASRERQRAVVF